MSDPAPAPENPAPAESWVAVTAYFPPIVGGSSTVAANLISTFRPETVRVISERPATLGGRHSAEPPPGVAIRRFGLPAALHRLPFARYWIRWGRYGLVPAVRRAVLEAVAAGAQRIVAWYPSWPFLLAAAQAARLTRRPWYTYHMDAPVPWEQAVWPDRHFLRRRQLPLLQSATGRLVISEALAEDFTQRFGLSSTVIRHGLDLRLYPPADPPPTAADGPLRLVHTGVVEHLQYESLRRIIDAVARCPELRAQVILSTPNRREDLAACGLAQPHVQIVALPTPEVRALQRSASVLLAVLPFFGTVKALDLTAFPTKLVEYMAAGVPILVHAPPDSFLAQHVRRHHYAWLVDKPDEAALLTALKALQADVPLRRRLAQRARQTAEELYALPRVAQAFAQACGLAQTALKPDFR
ncbi:MAG: glycosyltransferase [Verrucomicrobiae bacterium]|nr:glycosyltransferase [Verrucomicrobiae bacterium]